MHCTGVSKAILAFLKVEEAVQIVNTMGLLRFTDRTITDGEALSREMRRIRARGFALDDGEHEEGIRCVGVPICDAKGRAVASRRNFHYSALKIDSTSARDNSLL
jgi:DNA-binding IclR family transcriptional regulator